MTRRYLALLAGVALVVIGMNEPVVAMENVAGAVGAAVTKLSVVGTVSGAIGGSVLGLSAPRTSTGVVGGSVVGAGSSRSMPGAIGATVAGLSVLAAAVGGIGGVGPSGAGGNGFGVTGVYGTAADASEPAGDIADSSVGGSNGSGVVDGDPSFMAGTTTYSDYPAIIGGGQNPDYTSSVFASTNGGDTSVGPTVMSTYGGDVSSSD